jgi:hypothetical protein
VVHSSNINEINRSSNQDETWKTVHNGLSSLFIVIYALLLFTTIASNSNLNQISMLWATGYLSIVSFVVSLVVIRGTQPSPKVVLS